MSERSPDLANPYREVRYTNGTVETVGLMRARSLVSRQLAEFVTDGPRRRGRPKGSKNKPKQNVSAEAVYARPDVPITDSGSPESGLQGSGLPDPTLTGDAVDTAGNKPLPSD